MGGRTLSVAHQATGRRAKSLLVTITTKRGPGSIGSTVLGSLALPVDGQQLPLSNNLQKQKARRKNASPNSAEQFTPLKSLWGTSDLNFQLLSYINLQGNASRGQLCAQLRISSMVTAQKSAHVTRRQAQGRGPNEAPVPLP